MQRVISGLLAIALLVLISVILVKAFDRNNTSSDVNRSIEHAANETQEAVSDAGRKIQDIAD